MALITCPECARQISEFALSCPGCGFPVKLLNDSQKPKDEAKSKPQSAQKRKKYKKLPNGTGTIKLLSGKRRNPYAAYPPCKGFQLNGSPKPSPAIGYFPTWHEAFAALAEYNKEPYDLSNPTFTEVYNLFYADKFGGKKKFSEATKRAASAAYKNLVPVHSRRFRELRKADYQSVLDNCTLRHASLELMLTLLHQMYRYAISADIIDKDYSAAVKINIPFDDEKGDPFSEEELQILWQNKDDLYVKTVLIQIYSGFRISAWKTIEINYEEQYFRGGVKTEAGKGRFVPIHPVLRELISSETIAILSIPSYRVKHFYPTLEQLGITTSKNGKKHTPHDCRHTFSWLCDRYKVDDLSKHLLMGHTLQGDVEKTVYGHRTEEELRSEMNKIEVPFCY